MSEQNKETFEFADVVHALRLAQKALEDSYREFNRMQTENQTRYMAVFEKSITFFSDIASRLVLLTQKIEDVSHGMVKEVFLPLDASLKSESETYQALVEELGQLVKALGQKLPCSDCVGSGAGNPGRFGLLTTAVTAYGTKLEKVEEKLDKMKEEALKHRVTTALWLQVALTFLLIAGQVYKSFVEPKTTLTIPIPAPVPVVQPRVPATLYPDAGPSPLEPNLYGPPTRWKKGFTPK